MLLEQPALIAQVHADSFDAGADIAIAATYQATVQGVASRGLDRAPAESLMRRAVAMACEARDAFWAVPANRIGRARPLVAASVGPYAAFLADGSEYRGDYALDEDAVVAWHRERFDATAAVVGALAQAIAVGINCTAPGHVAALIRAARAVTDTPIIVYPNAGETYDAITKRWITSATCVSFVDAARAWLEAGASAIGGWSRTTPADIAGLTKALTSAA